MPKLSAGILAFRRGDDGLEYFLVHPGGPLWARKDEGAWSIPKGEYEAGDDALEAAKREFAEETGLTADGPFAPLTPLRQPSGKRVSAWAMLAPDLDPGAVASNTFSLEWPPRSGRRIEVPEIDRAGWFDADEARRKLLKGQVGFVDQVERLERESAARE